MIARFAVCLSLLISLAIFNSWTARAETNVLFIFDASGSMKKKVEGKPRIDVAKKVFGEALSNMPGEVRLGLMVYGHRKPKDCKDIELIAPIGGEDTSVIADTVQELRAIGETPIADFLMKAAKSFNAFKGQKNSIILVTDGIEECKGDPCAAAQALKDAGLDVVVNIVGFTLGDKQSKALQCVTDITGGKYYAASNAAGLTEALKEVQQTVVAQTAEEPEDDNDVLAAKNGGTLVYAPNDAWNGLNRDHMNFQGPTYGGEAVWSFKDGKPATFDLIEVLIRKAGDYMLKDFEVLASDDLAGPFRSLGSFKTANAQVMPEGWQAFKFPQTTAKYVKVVFKSDHSGGYIAGSPLRLIGMIDENAPAAAQSESGGIDILAVENGGQLISAPNDAWQNLNRNHADFRGPTYGGEGVWSFKEGKPATFNRIEVMISKGGDYVLKNFEVLAGDDLAGPFHSLGNFTTQNTKVMPDGWQGFALPKTTARFVRVAFKSDHKGGYISGTPLRLFGSVDETAAAAESGATIEGINLVAQANGGMLLMGGNDDWIKLTDGDIAGRVALYTGEGVWAFRDEKPAMIEAVDIMIPQGGDYNLKDFEILVGDEGPTGAFRSVGKFTTQNTRLQPEGWQRFVFPKVQAKYVKLVFLTDHRGGYISGYEVAVIGTPTQ